jgi:hypothetical protein
MKRTIAMDRPLLLGADGFRYLPNLPRASAMVDKRAARTIE